MYQVNEFKMSAMLGGHIVKVIFDPLQTHGANKERLLAACGLIPSIFSEAAGEPDVEDAEGLYKAAVRLYGFGDYSGTDWGTIERGGRYVSSYDEDPPLSPLAVFRWPFGVEVLVYPHAIIGVRDDNSTIISRMD